MVLGKAEKIKRLDPPGPILYELQARTVVHQSDTFTLFADTFTLLRARHYRYIPAVLQQACTAVL